MKKIIKYCLVLILLPCINSCNGSDDTKELTGGYFLRIEAKDLNDILSHGKGKQEIQANVLRYNYNDDFIIAEQKPNKTDDPLYEKQYNYINGRNNIYYWVIVINKNLLLGPLSKSQFEQEKSKYKVPNNLDLKPID